MNLEPPTSHCLNAANGWLELGNAPEAMKELDSIAAEFQTHPDVVEARWQTLAHLKDWGECLRIGEDMVKNSPSKSVGWVHRSYALHEMGRTEDALQSLLPALARFPDSWIIRYNLSCYYCRMKNPEQALRFYRQACRLGDFSHIREMALEDSDLADIREKISGSQPGEPG